MVVVAWFGEWLELQDLELINPDFKETLIYELEACASHAACVLCKGIRRADIICFTDNEAVLSNLITGKSDPFEKGLRWSSHSMQATSRHVLRLEAPDPKPLLGVCAFWSTLFQDVCLNVHCAVVSCMPKPAAHLTCQTFRGRPMSKHLCEFALHCNFIYIPYMGNIP